MKHGKRPTLRQKKAIEWSGLQSSDWLVNKVDHGNGRLHIEHRFTGSEKIIPL